MRSLFSLIVITYFLIFEENNFFYYYNKFSLEIFLIEGIKYLKKIKKSLSFFEIFVNNIFSIEKK